MLANFFDVFYTRCDKNKLWLTESIVVNSLLLSSVIYEVTKSILSGIMIEKI